MKACILGHSGMVGSALMRKLGNLRHADVLIDCGDLRDQRHTRELVAGLLNLGATHIFLCAAKVGGIQANLSYPAEFIEDNLRIELNVIEMARRCDARLVYFGSSCIYPRDAQQPIPEEALMTGPLEPSNEPYAIAKIAGIKMLQAYEKQYGMKSLILMPCNLYGPGDNFDLETGHVLPSLIRRFVEAKESGAESVTLWGTGVARREFLHVDDLAEAAVYLAESGVTGMVNVGKGTDQTIGALANMIRLVVGYTGLIGYDPNKPDGTPRKLLDISRLRQCMTWTPRTVREGIEETLAWYLQSLKQPCMV
ncbi:MAG TPA: GDP-L-fucose synthase [Candidatus Sulfotelmatobacter sp.]|nr:GDP-L-fucose synthase [Candidatus Sulfotelmatobacter sp.]